MERIKGTPHSPEVINKIIELSLSGTMSKDIWKNSVALFGYKIKQSTISNILKRNGINAKKNTIWHRKRKNY